MIIIGVLLTFVGLLFLYLVSSKIASLFGINIDDKKKADFTNMCIVVLTIVSIIIAFNAYDISQNQLKVDKINHQPQFSFQSYRDDTNHFEWFKIYNTGFYTDKIETLAPLTFFRIEYTDNTNMVKKTKMYCIVGYRDIGWPGNAQNDELMVYGDLGVEPYQKEDFYSNVNYEEGSYYKLMKVIDAIRNVTSSNNVSANLVIYEYVYANYTDVYNENHDNIYYRDGPYSNRLNDEEKEEILNLVFYECPKKGQYVDIDKFDDTAFLKNLLS